MSKFSSNNSKQFLGNLLKWMGISLAISLTVSLILPFPISLVVIIGIYLLLNFYLNRRAIAKMRDNGVETFGSISSMFGSMSGMTGSSLKYYCISCGTQHKQVSCPSCGSKIKKARF
jgi:hypothetical protein